MKTLQQMTQNILAKTAFITISAISVYTIYRKIWRNYVTVPAHIEHQSLLGDLDYGADIESDDLINVKFDVKTRPRLAKRLARDARISLSRPTRTKANLIVVSEWISREARRLHVRNKDLARVLPIAIELTFMSTPADNEARLVTLSSNYQEQLRLDRTLFYTRGKPTLFNWLGPRLYEPVAEAG
jgi:hypothetical protein